MNILFILGNGFDKAQGLATSYPEFYEEYQKIKPASEFEAQLKKDIQSDYQTWADLEEGLGKYSAHFTDINEFREVLRILNSRLKDYLKAQTLRIDTMGLSREKLINYLKNPDTELEPKQSVEYNDFFVTINSGNVYIDCVTLNYTDTFEVVYDNQDAFLGRIGSKDVPVFFKQIYHLHGSLDNMILVGVNDVSQITNEAFRESADLREEFVKPEINNGCENMMNETFSQLIQEASIIVLFGVSVGITDSVWWQAIGKRMDNPKENLRLIYYPYDLNKDTGNYPFRKRRWSQEYISFLKDRMGIQASVEDLRNRIYVGINKPFMMLS